MKIKFKDARYYQTKKWSIVIDLGGDLLFILTKDHAEGFDLYGLEDFSQEEFIKYYDVVYTTDETEDKN